jgi:hypothetical protein
LSLRRHRALLLSGLALLAASGAACSAVLGLDQPTLACASTPGCADAGPPGTDATAPVMDSSGSSSGGDSAPPPDDSGSDTRAPDTGSGPEDAGEDAPSGVRCGPLASAIYCSDPTAFCCLTLNGSSATYTCAAGQSDCSGYSIACASDEDCNGNDICCFYGSAIKCETSCGTGGSVVCDPSLPPSADQCNSGQSCVPVSTYQYQGYELPYDGCQ